MFKFHYAQKLPKGRLALLRNGTLRLYAAGAIVYEDIFGGRWLHRFLLVSRLPFWSENFMTVFEYERGLKPRQPKQGLWEKANHRLKRLLRR